MALSNDAKLRALGLKFGSGQTDSDSTLFEAVEAGYNSTYSDFLNDVQAVVSFDDYETRLVNQGVVSAAEASDFRARVEARFNSYTEFTNNATSFSDFQSFFADFGSGSTVAGETRGPDGLPNSGVKFHAEAGTSREGVEVPAGTVEIFGPRIQHSTTSNTDEAETQRDLQLSVSNFTVSNDTPQVGESVTYEADVFNNSSFSARPVISLLEDNERVETTTVELPPSSGTTVSFGRSYSSIREVIAQIEDSQPKQVTVLPDIPFV